MGHYPNLGGEYLLFGLWTPLEPSSNSRKGEKETANLKQIGEKIMPLLITKSSKYKTY